ncbi:MAG: hypothetical protein EZS28_036782, partial [Streblomastix strix]
MQYDVSENQESRSDSEVYLLHSVPDAGPAIARERDRMDSVGIQEIWMGDQREQKQIKAGFTICVPWMDVQLNNNGDLFDQLEKEGIEGNSSKIEETNNGIKASKDKKRGNELKNCLMSGLNQLPVGVRARLLPRDCLCLGSLKDTGSCLCTGAPGEPSSCTCPGPSDIPVEPGSCSCSSDHHPKGSTNQPSTCVPLENPITQPVPYCTGPTDTPLSNPGSCTCQPTNHPKGCLCKNSQDRNCLCSSRGKDYNPGDCTCSGAPGESSNCVCSGALGEPNTCTCKENTIETVITGSCTCTSTHHPKGCICQDKADRNCYCSGKGYDTQDCFCRGIAGEPSTCQCTGAIGEPNTCTCAGPSDTPLTTKGSCTCKPKNHPLG